MKNVYIEPAWKLALSYQELMNNPPPGYRFFTNQGGIDRTAKLTANIGFAYNISSALQNWGVPVFLMKAYLDRFKDIPQETDLTFALTHLVLRKEPWILDMQAEAPAILVGPEWHFPRYRGIVRRVLLSPYCKKVITSIEAGRQALIKSLNAEEMADKTGVVYPAVPKKPFAKSYKNDRVRLLFVNSGNLPGLFELKGGKEALAVFVKLRRRYPKLELVIRSDVPTRIKEPFKAMPGLRIIEQVLPWKKLEVEFQKADIFLSPTHVTPRMVFLDAMSYELPVVTTDVYGNMELVKNGQTGFIVPKSSLATDFPAEAAYGHTKAFAHTVVKQVDPKMVAALVEKLSLLIENPELRRRMGSAGRWEVERGKFSIANRNQALKQILDEATSSGDQEEGRLGSNN